MTDSDAAATGDMLTVAIESASDVLDTQQRTWLLGVAHMTDYPSSGEFSEEAVRRVIDIAMSTVQFPSGPIDFIPAGFTQTLNPDFQMITLAGETAPHLELKIGFGIAGVVAVGLTRSDTLDSGATHPGAVVLTDLESVLADTVTLALGSALELAYTGPIDFRFAVAQRRADVEVTFFAIDEDSARLQECPDCGPDFDPVGGRLLFTDQTTPRQVHKFIYDMACDASRQFGVVPQLVEMLAEGDDSYHGDPLDRDKRR